jgi:hypothetical protein
MIRPDDFAIEITPSERGVRVCVTHKPTGNQRIDDGVADGAVGKSRDALIAELRRLLFRAEDVICDTGLAEGGDYIRVVHIPSGIERWAMRRDSTHQELLDEVLEELYSGSETNDKRWPVDVLLDQSTHLDTMAAPPDWPRKWQNPGPRDRLVWGCS